MEHFGAILRQLRTAANLSQEALAERAGISVRAVAYLEGDQRTPYPRTIRRLADALELDARQRGELAAWRRPATPGLRGPRPLPIPRRAEPPPTLTLARGEMLLLTMGVHGVSTPIRWVGDAPRGGRRPCVR